MPSWLGTWPQTANGVILAGDTVGYISWGSSRLWPIPNKIISRDEGFIWAPGSGDIVHCGGEGMVTGDSSVTVRACYQEAV